MRGIFTRGTRERRLAIMFAITVLGVAGGSSSRVVALPSYESDYLYYDMSQQLVGEDYRFCTGGHVTYGDPTLAQPGYVDLTRYACDENGSPQFQHCWGTIDSAGVKHWEWCDPPE